MKKECKTHMLPTKGESQIHEIDKNYLYFSISQAVPADRRYHLYITDDSKIEEGDWVYNHATNKIFQPKGLAVNLVGLRKIIASTDKSLTVKETIKVGDIVNSSKEDFNIQQVHTQESANLYNKSDHYFKCLPQIPQDFIKQYCENPVESVLVEYEFNGGACSLEEGCTEPTEECTCEPIIYYKPTLKDNCIIISPIEEKKKHPTPFSLIRKFTQDHPLERGLQILDSDIEKWIKENL